MPMALQTLPPLLMFPTETAPPLAEAVATPPFPAEAVSMNCAAALPTPAKPTAAPATTALMRLFICSPLLPAGLRSHRRPVRQSPSGLTPTLHLGCPGVNPGRQGRCKYSRSLLILCSTSDDGITMGTATCPSVGGRTTSSGIVCVRKTNKQARLVVSTGGGVIPRAVLRAAAGGLAGCSRMSYRSFLRSLHGRGRSGTSASALPPRQT